MPPPNLPDGRFYNPFGRLPSLFPPVHPDAPQSLPGKFDAEAEKRVREATDAANRAAASLSPNSWIDAIDARIKKIDWQSPAVYVTAILIVVFGFIMLTKGPSVTIERLKG